MAAQRNPILHLVPPAPQFRAEFFAVSPTPSPAAAGLVVPQQSPVLLVASDRQRYAWLTGEVHAAPDTLEALANAITQPYAAMLVEVSLADGRESGHELVHMLRSRHRVRCPILLVADFQPLPSDRATAIGFGATDLIQRDYACLLDGLRSLLSPGDAARTPAAALDRALDRATEPTWLASAVELAREFMAGQAACAVSSVFTALHARQAPVEWAHVVSEVAQLIDDLDDRATFMRLARRAPERAMTH